MPIATNWKSFISAKTKGNYYQIFHPVNNFPDEKGFDLKAFKKYYFDPRNNKLAATKSGKIFAYVFGYVAPRTLIAWSLLLIVNNILVYTENESYAQLKSRFPVWVLFYAGLPVIGLLFLERLRRQDFRRYQRPASDAG